MVHGNLVTQDAEQAQIGVDVANGLAVLFYALFTAPFVIETAVNMAPSVASTATTTANVARVAFRNFAKPFLEEFTKELIGNGFDPTKVDFFDALTRTVASKFKFKFGKKEFIELLNSGFDFTIENGASDVFGASGKKKDEMQVGIDFLFSQLSIMGSETFDEKQSKMLDIFIEKAKNQLSDEIQQIKEKKKINDK